MFPHQEIAKMQVDERIAAASRANAVPRVAALRRRSRLRLRWLLDALRLRSSECPPEAAIR